MSLETNWSVENLVSRLPEFRRFDDGRDLLVFYLVGKKPHRFVYIYLYGDDPDAVYYDLEDDSIETESWDNAVERGEVRSLAELRRLCERWLGSA